MNHATDVVQNELGKHFVDHCDRVPTPDRIAELPLYGAEGRFDVTPLVVLFHERFAIVLVEMEHLFKQSASASGRAGLRRNAEMGALAENMVAGHLYSLSQQTNVRLYHWRDKDDEVDLVYDHPVTPMAFEISTRYEHHRWGLVAFSERYKKFRGKCFLVTPNCEPRMPQPGTINEIGQMPLDLFLLAVSSQAEKELENNLLSLHRQA
jgi:Domain of unknown function (DUF4143)